MPCLRFPAYGPAVARGDNRCQMPTVCNRPLSLTRRLPFTQARREHKTMAIATMQTASLVAFTLPSSPYSVQMARFYVRAALSYHDLGDYADDAQTITSELVTNAVTHADASAVGLELTWLEGVRSLVIVVTDPCPLPPVKCDPVDDAVHWRGLHLVEALSARWGWRPQDPGKAVFAILTRKA